MSAIAENLRFLHPDAGLDLPFGPAVPAPADPVAALDEPIYIGAVDAGQRGAFGPITLELMLAEGRVELGPFVLPSRQATRLWHLLGVALGVLGEAPPRRPAPLPESGRGIAGWHAPLARNTTGLAAAGCPREGETLP